MATFQITCGGPGPHVPASGILGTSDRAQGGVDVRCASDTCVKPPDVAATNKTSIETKARTALASNTTYLALTTPTNAQVAAQVRALTQTVNGIIRTVLDDYSGDS